MDRVDFWREVRCSLKMLDALASKERASQTSTKQAKDVGGVAAPPYNARNPRGGIPLAARGETYSPGAEQLAAARSEEIHAALMTFIRAIEKQYPELAPPQLAQRRRKRHGADDAE